MKERVSDYENKKTEERTKIRLFSPLTAIRYPRYDWEDFNGKGILGRSGKRWLGRRI